MVVVRRSPTRTAMPMGASVVTAALRPDLTLLREAGTSLTNATCATTPWVLVLDDARPGESDDVTAALEPILAESTITLTVLPLPFRASAGGARSIGLAHVTTRWFCVLDADDLLPAGSVDVQLALLQRYHAETWRGSRCTPVCCPRSPSPACGKPT